MATSFTVRYRRQRADWAKKVENFCCTEARAIMRRMRESGYSYREIAAFVNMDHRLKKPPGRLNCDIVSAWVEKYHNDLYETATATGSIGKAAAKSLYQKMRRDSMARIVADVMREKDEAKNQNL
jgi:hypothetical protein